MRFDRGAAYWTDAYEEELEILKKIGLGQYKEKHPIPEPIDSYFWNGTFYPGIWEHETLEKLPSSFALFEVELKRANENNLIPNQPFEESRHLELDALTAAQWIREMPRHVAHLRDPKAKEVYERFKHEIASGKLNRQDPMIDVIQMLNLYCRSALGSTTDQVSAVAFANFYISEIETRFTTSIGTGQAAQNMYELLKTRSLVDLQPLSPAQSIKNTPSGVEVVFVDKAAAKKHSVRAKYAIYAAQLKFAPRLIEGFAADPASRQQAEYMAGLKYADYSVHAVRVKGHPFRATYDTWTRASDARDDDFTDVILGRWMEDGMKGYEGFRDFARNPEGDSIMTIYHPLFTKLTDDEKAKQIGRSAVERMKAIYNPMLKQNWGTEIKVQHVLTSRWPYSVHIAEPGHFSKKAKLLRKPYKNVFFANNNMGTPAFEEALFRGHCAANNILKRFNPRWNQKQAEPWTKCVLEPAR